MAGLRNPTVCPVCATEVWLTSAMKPAHCGDDALVPPTVEPWPFLKYHQMTTSATIATSG